MILIKLLKPILFKLFVLFLLFLPIIINNSHGIFILIILLLLFIWELSSICFKTFALYVLFASLFYIHIVMHWGKSDIGSRIEVVLASPTYEIYEYFENFINLIDVFLIIYFVLIYIFILFYKRTNLFFKKPVLKIMLCMVSAFYLIYLMSNTSTFNIFSKIQEAEKRNDFFEKRINYLNSISQKNVDINASKYDKIIIIIGESASKHHMSIYNYNKITTPFLESIKPFVYNSIAPINGTRYSIAIDLTNANVNNWNSFFKSESIVTNLKKAGYKTYWISNQRARGANDSYIASMASEADKSYFLNQTSKNYSNIDNVIVDKLKSIMPRKDEKEVFFLHLMGSHSSYSSRYKDIRLIKNPKNIDEEYDNSIYYTDYIISEIYKIFNKNKDNILLVYFSDHGEVVSEQKHGHGFAPGYKDEYDVPLIIYSSVNNKYLYSLKKENKIINLESLGDIIVNTLNNNNKKEISNSYEILNVSPNNIKDYRSLKRYKH